MVQGNEIAIPSGNEKRKSVKKSPTSGTTVRATKKRAAAGPREIVFKELPNPYQPATPPYIWIDHPLQNERLLAPTYVIRLGVGGAELVELSVDKGPWRACRLTSGYWWFDWDAIAPGKHVLVARMKALDGRWFRTPPCSCDYRP
jgi:hypothetical protein